MAFKYYLNNWPGHNQYYMFETIMDLNWIRNERKDVATLTNSIVIVFNVAQGFQPHRRDTLSNLEKFILYLFYRSNFTSVNDLHLLHITWLRYVDLAIPYEHINTHRLTTFF